MPSVLFIAPRLHLRRRERVVDTYSTPRWLGRGTIGGHHTRGHCVTDSQLPEPRVFEWSIGGLGFIGNFGGSVGVHDPQRQASTKSTTASRTDEGKLMEARNE